jgi:hypothetical protein
MMNILLYPFVYYYYHIIFLILVFLMELIHCLQIVIDELLREKLMMNYLNEMKVHQVCIDFVKSKYENNKDLLMIVFLTFKYL